MGNLVVDRLSFVATYESNEVPVPVARVMIDKAWGLTPTNSNKSVDLVVDRLSVEDECHVTSDTLPTTSREPAMSTLPSLTRSNSDPVARLSNCSQNHNINWNKSRTPSFEHWETSWFDKIESINRFNMVVPRTPIRSRAVSKRVSLYPSGHTEAQKKIILDLVETL